MLPARGRVATGRLVVLGVDPGTVRTGWGVVQRAGPILQGIAAGTIRASERESLPERLKRIHDGLAEVILTYGPAVMAVEDIFYARFARAALQLGQARGVVLLAGAEAGLAVESYAPAVVKRSVAGSGHAEKKQLARVVGAILGWRELPEPDAADALAVAITHARAAAARIPLARHGRWRRSHRR